MRSSNMLAQHHHHISSARSSVSGLGNYHVTRVHPMGTATLRCKGSVFMDVFEKVWVAGSKTTGCPVCARPAAHEWGEVWDHAGDE